jgi:cytochrome P450
MWIGPKPRVNIMNPEQLKDIFSKIYDFQKPNGNPIVKLLATGLADYEGEKWATHRKIINPAFHLEKLKVITLILPFIFAVPFNHFRFNDCL